MHKKLSTKYSTYTLVFNRFAYFGCFNPLKCFAFMEMAVAENKASLIVCFKPKSQPAPEIIIGELSYFPHTERGIIIY